VSEEPTQRYSENVLSHFNLSVGYRYKLKCKNSWSNKARSKKQKKKSNLEKVIAFLVRTVAIPFFYFYFLPILYTSVLDIICLLIFFLEMMYPWMNQLYYTCVALWLLKQWNKAEIDTPIFHLFSFFLYEINKVKERKVTDEWEDDDVHQRQPSPKYFRMSKMKRNAQF
jgi:hypothetical protein